MKPVNKLKQPQPARRTHKTKDDFLQWLRKRDALKNQAAEEQKTKAARAASRALMVWADDGGPPA